MSQEFCRLQSKTTFLIHNWKFDLHFISNFHYSNKEFIFQTLCGRRGSLMVSALDSGSNGPGSSPGQDTALCS